MSSVDERKLIEAVRAHECIYNNKMYEYKCVFTKQTAWAEIASKLNKPVPDCRAKWNQLRNAYIQALIRRRSLKKWKYEEEMSFLLPYTGFETSETVLSSTNENNDPNDDSSETQHNDEFSNGEPTPKRTKRNIDDQEDFSQIIQEKRPRIKVEEGVTSISQTVPIPNNIRVKREDEINTIETPKIMPLRFQEDTRDDDINQFHMIQSTERIPPGCQQDAREENIDMAQTIQTQKIDFQQEMFHMIKEKLQGKKVHKDEIDLLFESLAKAVKQLPKTEQVKVKIGVTKIVYDAQMRCGNQLNSE